MRDVSVVKSGEFITISFPYKRPYAAEMIKFMEDGGYVLCASRRSEGHPILLSFRPKRT